MSGLAALGHTIVATLHQPRAAIWALLHQARPRPGLPWERSRQEQCLPALRSPALYLTASAWRRAASQQHGIRGAPRQSAWRARVVVMSALERSRREC